MYIPAVLSVLMFKSILSLMYMSFPVLIKHQLHDAKFIKHAFCGQWGYRIESI